MTHVEFGAMERFAAQVVPDAMEKSPGLAPPRLRAVAPRTRLAWPPLDKVTCKALLGWPIVCGVENVAEAGLRTPVGMERLLPVPLIGKVCAVPVEPPELSMTIKVAARAPDPVGVNVMLMTQEEF
jgi:hypothetical protein